MLTTDFGHSYRLLNKLVVNFSDFSYIRSITAGYDYAYFGTTNGLIRYNISEDRWGLPLTGIEGLLGRDILRVEVSRNDDNLWVETNLGIFEYNRTHNIWNQIPSIPNRDQFVRHLQPDPTYFAPPGYNYLSTGFLADFDDRRYQLTDIIDDGWSNLWIGTWGLGAIRSDNSDYQMELLNYGLLYRDVGCLETADDQVLIGGVMDETLRPGLTIYDNEENSFNYALVDHYNFDWTNSINDIAVGENDIYAATDNGLLIIDRDTYNVIDQIQVRTATTDNIVYSVASNGDSVFVGTRFGLGIVYPGVADSLKHDKTVLLSDLAILTMAEGPKALWIGTNHGVYRLVYKTGRIEELNVWQVSGTTQIHDITIGPENIWIAAEDNMVSIDRKTAGVVDYPEINNYGGVRAVDSQGDMVAVATGNGVLMYFFTKKKSQSYLYTINDGLLSNDVQDVKFDGEYLWIGSDQGLTRFWHRHPGLYH